MILYRFEEEHQYSLSNDVNFAQFVEQLPKDSTTIVILDNAPTHTSNLFQDKIEEWEEQGLILYFLPTHSP